MLNYQGDPEAGWRSADPTVPRSVAPESGVTWRPWFFRNPGEHFVHQKRQLQKKSQLVGGLETWLLFFHSVGKKNPIWLIFVRYWNHQPVIIECVAKQVGMSIIHDSCLSDLMVTMVYTILCPSLYISLVPKPSYFFVIYSILNYVNWLYDEYSIDNSLIYHLISR